MLALLGLMGAVVAGVLAEGIMGATQSPPADDPATDGDDLPETTGGDLLDDPDGFLATDWPAEADPMEADADLAEEITSSDLPPSPPQPFDLTGSEEDDLLSGSAGADRIHGQSGDDQIDADAGQDQLFGGAGHDRIWAGTEADWVEAGAGDDRIEGQAGDDQLFGGEDRDQLAGHEGDDLLDGGEGDDSLLGGMGDDRLFGQDGDDWLSGGAGDDHLTGGLGFDILDGNSGDDRLIGAQPGQDDLSPDFLNGGEGDDQLWLGAYDTGHGGAGSDDFIIAQWLAEGGYTNIVDFDAREDQIVVVYDPLVHSAPELSLEEGADGASTLIKIDGTPVASVNGTVALEDIHLLAA